jgi:hypothetical protein
MNRHETIQLGNEAAALLDNKTYQKITNLLQDETLYAWGNTGATQTEVREDLWLFYVAVRRVQQALVKMVETGKHEQFLMEEEKRPMDKSSNQPQTKSEIV